MKDIDVIILANSNTADKYFMTAKAIRSIHCSSSDIKFNITVAETAKQMPSFKDVGRPWPGFKSYGRELDSEGGFMASGDRYIIAGCGGRRVWVDENAQECICRVGNQVCSIRKRVPTIPQVEKDGPVCYLGATVVNLPDDFNYNKAVNYGIDHGTAEWLVVANNDIFVYPGAFDKLLVAGYDSVSPMTTINTCFPQFHGVKEGYWICGQIMGFCIMTKRSVFKQFPGGHLDERYFYFHQDIHYAMMLRHLGIKHACVGDALVDHIQSQSHPVKPIEQAWSLESTRRYYHQFPEDYGVYFTGDHRGGWTEAQIFDKEWTKAYEAAHPEYYVGYGDAVPSTLAPTPTPKAKAKPRTKKVA